MPERKSAIISSTVNDLPEHRKQVLDACLSVDVFPCVMETLPARDADAIRVSLDMVNAADIYIGVFAWRYGYVPEGHEISITEIEFNRAVERRIPILIFLSHKEHPITFEMVETGEAAQKRLAALKERASKGRGRREFKTPSELRAHVIQALADLRQRELWAGSPTDVIGAEKHRLEQLDPRFSVDITATAKTMNVQMRPIESMAEFPKIKFLKEDRGDDLQAFLEKGQPFQVKAASVEVENSPILNDLFRESGDANLTFGVMTLNGCLQFHYGSQTEPLCLQFDGEWVIAPKRNFFDGQLNESPLKVVCTSEKGDDGKWKHWVMILKMNWGAWEGQALRALAYFPEMDAFFKEEKFYVRFYIRGYREWSPQGIALDNSGKNNAIEAMGWLQKCKRVAERIGANPPFPGESAVGEGESTDVRLLVKLLEEGGHEQENAGQICVISGEAPSKNDQIPQEVASMTFAEQVRVLDFFGVKVPIGPIQHTWTDLELIETRPVDNGRVEMTFKGRANSVYRIGYQQPR